MEMQKNIDRPEAVFFDLDGTLVMLGVNWENLRGELHTLFIKYGIDMDFRPMLSKVEDALSIISTKFPEKEAKMAKEVAYGIIEAHEVRGAMNSKLIESARDIIGFLKEKGCYIGIISRNSRRTIEVALENHKISDIDIIVSREDTSLIKPHPDQIFAAFKRLEVKNPYGIMVGDHPFDIVSGKSAGIITVGVLTGVGTEKELRDAGADYIFENLKEFKQFLGGVYENPHS
ncbi:MAG TPA: HAD family hydrolase [Euryarchaeota archaeon]|nr:HAD family hydrolase [Euryarchaeota archaeon]